MTTAVRVGVLADVHGNLPALRAVVAALQNEGVDRFVCAGDLVGYGPFPNECVEMVASLGAVCVAGNHDLIAIGRLDDTGCSRLARSTLAWTRKHLSQEAREYLEGLPLETVAEGVVLAHGAPGDPRRYVRDGAAAAAELAKLAQRHPAARTLVLGHTHLAAAWATDGRRLRVDGGVAVRLSADAPSLLNPGAVGQSRERRAWARSLVLDIAEGVATFHATTYDVGACRRALRAAGLPLEAAHLSPTVTGRAVRKVRRLAAGVRPLSRPAKRDAGAPAGG